MRRAWTATAALLAACTFAPMAQADVIAGDLVVADPSALGGDGALIVVNPENGAQRPISYNAISGQKLFRDPTGVAFQADGQIVVADPEAFDGSGGLIRVDPVTGAQAPISNNEISAQDLFQDPVSVAVTPSELLVVDRTAFGGNGGVIRVDPQTGQASPLSNNALSPTALFSSPYGIAVERNGTILVSDTEAAAPLSGTDGAIITVDPANGAQKIVTSNDTSQADLFADPLGIVLETPGTLLVANTAPGPSETGVVLVNRSSGQQYGLATDGAFAAPTGIAVDFDGQAAVTDSAAFGGTGGVIRVDPVTGARVIVSGNPTASDAQFVDPSGILVVPPTCQGLYATIVGTEGADALTGTPGPDVISARGGNDIVHGKGGADLICGDQGRDRLIGDEGRDRFLGGTGGDVILGGRGADVALGEQGNDKIDGGRGNDKLRGAQKRDNLVGGKGRDVLSGGPGRDRLTGGPGHDRLRGGPGRDKQKQ